MPESTLSLLNVFDLPPEQRGILLHLTRKGATNPLDLAETLDMPIETVSACIEALIAVNKVRINPRAIAF